MKYNKSRDMSYKEMVNMIYQNDVTNLTMSESSYPYVIPMLYSVDNMNNGMTIRLDAYEDGKKMLMMDENKNVVLQMTEMGKDYKSVLAYGKARVYKNRYPYNRDYAKIFVDIDKMTGKVFWQ